MKGGGVWLEDFGRITWFSRCERSFSVNCFPVNFFAIDDLTIGHDYLQMTDDLTIGSYIIFKVRGTRA